MRYSILTEGLRKRYGDTLALDGLDLAVPTGSVCGLLGPNGAGKTTSPHIGLMPNPEVPRCPIRSRATP